MSQPPFQPPPQPAQPPQPPQNPANPYAQPAPPPQQPPGFGPSAPQQPPMQAGPAPVPGQPPMMYGGPQPAYPMQPAPPFQAPPFGQRPNATGNPVGAVFLGFFVSFVIALLYTGVMVATYKDQTYATANVLYFAHAILNGAVVGALVGKVGRDSNGGRIGGAVVAALGAFFGYANALPVIIVKEQSFMALKTLLEGEPFFPAKAWWHNDSHGGVDWLNLLGLVVAAAAAWGIAYLIGKNRRQV
ncbi:hypothetical protein [Streptomyces sp. NPDC001401]|uniref:hypothetical protein n=1 Tax=Streptomyces sp. NPDC001401 TaxID=3364570 RepID=UPI0036B04C49